MITDTKKFQEDVAKTLWPLLEKYGLAGCLITSAGASGSSGRVYMNTSIVVHPDLTEEQKCALLEELGKSAAAAIQSKLAGKRGDVLPMYGGTPVEKV